ncbi:MFS-type transporter SLC18B1 isoform X2 [Nematostella vectensis]|uniref:MFS-type transporter SLC18B1 isoform X2 n=1 Tax=Nematostella vectensis TaxID=45351 RepID=UPI0020779A41|nr:MFS-type transporter SLC18B1 isoform X2 [Nematostella vectensis]
MHNHSSENERQALETDDEVHEIMSNGACTANVRPSSRASIARSLSAASTIIHTTRWTPRRVFVFILLSLVYFLTYSCLSLLSTFFTVEAQQKGARDTVIGLIFGMYPLVAFASAMMYGGWVIPRWGPKFVLLAGLVLNGGANILFAYVPHLPSGPVFIIFCFVIRTVSAFGGSACENAVLAILIGEFHENVSAIMSAVELFAGLAFAIGPLLGGLMYTAGGFKLPFLVMAVLLCLSIPAVLLFLPNTEAVTERSENKIPIFRAVTIPGVILVAIQLTLGLSLFSFLDPTLAPFTKKMGLNAAYTGLLFMVLSLAYALSTAVVGRICEKTKAFRTCLGVSFLLMGTGLLFLGPAPFLDSFVPQKKIWLLCISLGLNGVGGSLILIPSVPEMQRCCLGFAGPVLGGILVDKLGFPWMATVMAFLALSLMVLSAAWALFSWISLTNNASEERKPLLAAATRKKKKRRRRHSSNPSISNGEKQRTPTPV